MKDVECVCVPEGVCCGRCAHCFGGYTLGGCAWTVKGAGYGGCVKGACRPEGLDEAGCGVGRDGVQSGKGTQKGLPTTARQSKQKATIILQSREIKTYSSRKSSG